MLLAMGVTAFLCVFIGTYPWPLYSLLPFPVAYEPYTATHVLSQSQLLFYSSLAFTLLILSGIYPAEMRATNLDADWLYRKGGKWFYGVADRGLNGLNGLADRVLVRGLAGWMKRTAEDGLVTVASWGLMFLWRRGVSGQDNLSATKEEIQGAVRAGTLPIGLGAAAATLFISLIYLLAV
jgi:multicomponent Na+:H+ antiporter subunit D